MIGLMSYLALNLGLLGLLALTISNNAKTDIASALHFALLSTMAYQGLSSLFFAYTDVPLSFSSMDWALLVGIAVTVVVAMRTNVFSGADGHSIFQPSIDVPVIVAITTSYLVATIAGVLFFSMDLIPSSMTGDPARHFQLLINLISSGPAYAMKPVYYLWAGIFSHLPLPLAQDQLFVAFNIFSLGLVTSSVSLLMIRVLGPSKWGSILLITLLTAFGYPFFALQYGYYTLLLSAAFLFSAFALLLDYLKTESTTVYFLVTLLACGGILTHSYFAPELFLIAFAVTLWRSHQMQRSYWRQTVKHVPYWMFAGCVVILSNSFFHTGDSMQSLGHIIQARGFGTNDFSDNILPFAALSVPYLVANDKARHNQILLLFVACTAGFSYVMYELYAAGLAAPYYVNRNQLVLIPLLAIGTMGTLQRVEIKFARVADLVRFALLLLVLLPYFFYRNPPLAMTNVRLLDLLPESSGFLYFVNAKTASYSPLQFTARDRLLLESAEHTCFDKTPEKMAVLGTDHQVIWFGIYANVYPSLLIRQDGFIQQPGYLANYEMWKKNTEGQYLAVIKHINYFIPRNILSEIRSSAELVCEGDSFVIYRKPLPSL